MIILDGYYICRELHKEDRISSSDSELSSFYIVKCKNKKNQEVFFWVLAGMFSYFDEPHYIGEDTEKLAIGHWHKITNAHYDYYFSDQHKKDYYIIKFKRIETKEENDERYKKKEEETEKEINEFFDNIKSVCKEFYIIYKNKFLAKNIKDEDFWYNDSYSNYTEFNITINKNIEEMFQNHNVKLEDFAAYAHGYLGLYCDLKSSKKNTDIKYFNFYGDARPESYYKRKFDPIFCKEFDKTLEKIKQENIKKGLTREIYWE